MKTKILSSIEAREKLLAGVNKMADAVGSTLGPMGQNVAIERTTPRGDTYDRLVVHDGVTVARSIELEDAGENMGAQLLKQASQKQVDAVGDGTTVVMILAQAIIQECLKLVATGVNPMSLRKGLEEGVKLLTHELEAMAIPITGMKDLKYIASISAEDNELGELVARTLDKVGKDGVVTVEESKGPETIVEHQEGMQLDKGYLHPYFVTNPERMEAIWENTYLLITDRAITTFNDIGPFLGEFVKTSKNLVIISPEVSGEALPLFIQNKLEGKLLTLCIQAPSFGTDQKNILQDIAMLTGGKFISEDAGYSLKDLTIEDLGFAEYVTATKEETIIVGGRGKKADIANRIASLKTSIEHEEGEFDKQRIKARLGKLTNGVAVIRVGGHTEVEMKERRERVLDSIASTRAAMEKGIVPGGEIVYLHIRKLLNHEKGMFIPDPDVDPKILESMKNSPSAFLLNKNGKLKKTMVLSEKEMSITEKILYKALYQPFLKLITNADLNETEIAIKLLHKGKNYGVDVINGEVKDLVKVGIVDPVLVPIHALHNALSVAIQIMTTQYIVVPVIDKVKGGE